jgi:hypothetical protein
MGGRLGAVSISFTTRTPLSRSEHNFLNHEQYRTQLSQSLSQPWPGGGEAPTQGSHELVTALSSAKRSKKVLAKVVYEVTLSSPTVEAAEEFVQANLIYDDGGEFGADPTPEGALGELPESWRVASFQKAVSKAWEGVRACLDDISESVKEQLDDQEEDFKASFQPEKGGTWEFIDEDDDDLHCWGDFPLLQADMSYLL